MMKKTLCLLLTLMIGIAAFTAASAETAAEAAEIGFPRFETIGQALEEAEYTGLNATGEQSTAVVVTAGGKNYRVSAALDQKAIDLTDAARDPENMENWVTLQAEAEAYINALPVTAVEEITALPRSDADLAGLTGKALEELQQYGFEWYSGELRDAEGSEDAVITVDCEMFCYDITLDASAAEYAKLVDESGVDAAAGLKVKGIVPAGLSWHAADCDYAADGSSAPDSLFNGAADFDLLSILSDALDGKDVQNMDPEALIDALVQMMPDQEETIRAYAPMLLSFLEQENAE